MAKSRRRKKSSSSSSDWKKSPAIAGVLIVVIFIIIGYNAGSCSSSSGNSILPDDYEHTFITKKLAGTDVSKIIIKIGNRGPKPFKVEGEWAWVAYMCNNENCVGRGKDKTKTYYFPCIDKASEARLNGKKLTQEEEMELMNEMSMPECPKCAKKFKKYEKRKDKKGMAKYDSSNIEQYRTEKSKAIMKKIQEEYRAKNKK